MQTKAYAPSKYDVIIGKLLKALSKGQNQNYINLVMNRCTFSSKQWNLILISFHFKYRHFCEGSCI